MALFSECMRSCAQIVLDIGRRPPHDCASIWPRLPTRVTKRPASVSLRGRTWSRAELSTEVVFLRKQLAFYQEHPVLRINGCRRNFQVAVGR
jgi:hypothetical protein